MLNYDLKTIKTKENHQIIKEYQGVHINISFDLFWYC